MLLVARRHLAALDLPHPDARAILAATGAGKSQAYALADRLADVLATLARSPGRPVKPPVATPPDAGAALTRAVLAFVADHPGCISGSATRRVYSDAFRLFILDLREENAALELERFAEAVAVPSATIDSWLRAGRPAPPASPSPPPPNPADEAELVAIESVIAAWRSWDGPFFAFCEHVRLHLRIDFGRSLIARALHVHQERVLQRRRGRTPDEDATRGAFEVFFPGAQWVGDGMQVDVKINDASFTFNVELDVDAASAALVGASIRDEEDSAAVSEAFRDGVATTGAPPLALLLDNRPSNHSDDVVAALGDTILMRATPERPENKAHVEGAFGLFAQHAPPLEIAATTPRALAREMLRLRLQTFARTLNHRPRRDRNWQTRIQLHRASQPTDDEIDAARRALRERVEMMNRARSTRLARADATFRAMLDDAFTRLGLQDPGQYFRAAIMRYDRDSAVDAIAIFEGKRMKNTLPQGADARYLLGIVKNLAHTHEADAITHQLLVHRLALRDRRLSVLETQREAELAHTRSSAATLNVLVDHATCADRVIDRFFWLDATAQMLLAEPEPRRRDLFRTLARRIHACFALAPRDRSALERRLLRLVWPLA